MFYFLKKNKYSFLGGVHNNLNRKGFLFRGAFLIFSSLIAAGISFAILVGATPIRPDSQTTTILVVLNLFFILFLSFFVWKQIRRIRLTRRQQKAASRLHVRIVVMFAFIAAVPAVMVAIVAAISLHIGLDRWFEIRTRTIIKHSLSIADAYILENARNLQGTTLSMAYDLETQQRLYRLDKSGFVHFITKQAIGRFLNHAALIKGDGSFIIKSETDSSFPMPFPPFEAVKAAENGLPALIEPKMTNIVGAIVKLKNLSDVYLYTVRLVDPAVIQARQIVQANINEYDGMEQNRVSAQLAFALPYLSLALMIVLTAIWAGIGLADRLVNPVRKLIHAATKVSKGNLHISVPVIPEDGDIAVLADAFNKMLLELQLQRNELITAKDMVDERRRFSEAVLSGVTAGVLGVDSKGMIKIINRSAESILTITKEEALGKHFFTVLPYAEDIFLASQKSKKSFYRDQVTFIHKGEERTFNIQITMEAENLDAADNSYVITVDDITDLVYAQRSNAWSDIARRIAHEIKNPLTPIQLSAERIRRKYQNIVSAEPEIFNKCIDTIIHQVEDIDRMVNEFSSFARMPKPEMRVLDLRESLKESIFLIQVTRQDILFQKKFEKDPLLGTFDQRLLTQAFSNIIKNATEAIEMSQNAQSGIIEIRGQKIKDFIKVDIIDNGRGFPFENKQKLLEPYVTTREKGTGLGFAIVRKIIEDHGGVLELHDVPEDFSFTTGAMVRVILPAL